MTRVGLECCNATGVTRKDPELDMVITVLMAPLLMLNISLSISG